MKPVESEEVARTIPERTALTPGSHRTTPETLEALISASPMAILTLNLDGAVELWNLAAEKIFGWQAEEVLGHPPPFVRPENQAEYAEFVQATVTGSTFSHVETQLGRRNGVVVDIAIASAPMTTADGRTVGIIQILSDISEWKAAARALERSEEKYRSIFESFADVYFETTPDGMLLSLSPSVESILGARPEELIGQSTARLYKDPTDRVRLRDQLLASDRVQDYEVMFLRKDGSEVPVSINARLTRDASGRPLKLHGTVRDVSERKRTELWLRETLDQLNATLNALPDMLFEVDSFGRICSCHTKDVDGLFESPERFVGRLVSDVLPPDAADTIRKAIDSALREGRVSGVSYVLEFPDGERWFEISMVPKGDPGASNPRLIAIARDITDRRKAQEELSSTTARYMTMINTVPAAMYVIDIDHRYVTVNDEFCRMVDKPSDQIVGQIVDDVVPRAIADPFSQADEMVMSTDKEWVNVEEKTTSANDEVCWLSATRVPLHDRDGKVIGVVGLLQDVTEQHRSRDQLVQADKLAAIGTLAAGVAHEINNPIGFISSNLNTMSKYVQKIGTIVASTVPTADPRLGQLTEIITDFKDAISESIDGATRVRDIVADLKTFSRVDRSEKELANLNEGINSTLNIVWNELKYKCKVQKELGDLPDLFCMPNQLNQVFMNILINAGHAIKHDQGLIVIKTWADDLNVCVSIGDNGEGISAAHLKKIFEPFFTTKDVGKGTGLGLSLAYDIVQKHGGMIDVQSEPGEGTTFTVILPREGVSDA